MLGISVYFRDYDSLYLKEAAERGVTYVFTSLQLQEDDRSTIKDNLLLLQKDCLVCGLKLIVDISPETKNILNIQSYDELKNFGVEVIRLDYGFDDIKEVIELSKQYQLILNASTLEGKYLKALKNTEIDMSSLTAMHNFYPQRFTALSLQEFINQNQKIKEYGLRTMAFVCGDEMYRYPFYEGLPTLEEHRGVNPYIATLQMIKECYVDDVMIGDSKAKLSTLTMMSKLCRGRVTIPAIIEPSYRAYLQNRYLVRKDISEHLLRLVVPRIQGIEPYHCVNRIKGSIVLLNKEYQRYSGEIQIVKRDLPFDLRCNVIGYVHPEYIELLQYIDAIYQVEIVEVSYGDF